MVGSIEFLQFPFIFLVYVECHTSPYPNVRVIIYHVVLTVHNGHIIILQIYHLIPGDRYHTFLIKMDPVVIGTHPIPVGVEQHFVFVYVTDIQNFISDFTGLDIMACHLDTVVYLTGGQ